MIQSTMWKEFDTMRREMESIFNGMRSRPVSTLPRAWFFGEAGGSYPALRVHQDSDAVYVEAALPGVDPEALDLTVEGNVLTVSGEKGRFFGESDKEVVRRSERATGKFVRRLTLPAEVDADRVGAEYTNGMLVVTLPKAEVAKPKQISIKAA